jgi:hypothetical protein
LLSLAGAKSADAGLYTTVFSVIKHDASFQAGIASGKFHGVINATTPMGRFTMQMTVSGSSEGVV